MLITFSRLNLLGTSLRRTFLINFTLFVASKWWQSMLVIPLWPKYTLNECFDISTDHWTHRHVRSVAFLAFRQTLECFSGLDSHDFCHARRFVIKYRLPSFFYFWFRALFSSVNVSDSVPCIEFKLRFSYWQFWLRKVFIDTCLLLNINNNMIGQI